MENKNLNEVMNILKGEISSGNYLYEFVSNYYLSRKLKNNSFEKVIEKFEDVNIKLELENTYKSDDKYIEKFNEIEDLTLEEIIEIINIISQYVGRSYGPENTTVKSIIDLSLELLDLSEEDILLDVGSGIGTTLLEASDKARISQLTGIEINRENYIISCILMDLFDLPLENIINSDVYTYDLSKFNSNKVFMNMPMGVRITSSKLESVLKLKFDKSIYKNYIKSADSSWIYALDIIENTKYEKFVMLMNGNPLYSDTHQDVRKILIEKGKIEAVIGLPSNILPYTAIPIYMVIFSHNNDKIKFVDGTNQYSDIMYRHTMEDKHIEVIISALKKDSKISKSVNYERLEKEDFTLNPLRYTVAEFPFEESVELKDVVKSINRGCDISKKDLDSMTSVQPTNIQYLMLQNFQDGIIDENLSYLENLDESYEKYLLKDNSIIISRLAPFKIGSVDKLKRKVLANGNLFFLEVDEEKINKNFLTAYLQSRLGLKEIEKYAKGSTMKTISIRDLEKVKIPKITIEKQIEIGEKFVLLNSEFKAIKKRTEDILVERLNIFEGGI